MMTVERWNTAYPVGTPVRFWPGGREGEGRKSFTRSPAWALGDLDVGTPVVSVEGYPGGIALSHIQVVDYAPDGTVGTLITNAADLRGRMIAEKIRRELVCCDVYRDDATVEEARTAFKSGHSICWWGEAAARLAEAQGR